MSAIERPIELKRDCEGIQIPDGHRIHLTAGASVRITQSLGGSYTVLTDWGAMVRISDRDADALGKENAVKATEPASTSAKPLLDQVWDKLRTTYDPEIPVNIVELGLVYVCELSELPSGNQKVEIKFTLTAPGCGMGDVLRSDIEEKVKSVPGVEEVAVEVVFEPAWDRSMMSEVARLQLGM
jgi:probable FeS assembly SUF system protein SufT